MTEITFREEVWKPIPGYEGLYEVSNWGLVRSLDREVRGRGGGVYVKKGRVLKGSLSQGRPRQALYDRTGEKKDWTTARLVLMAFTGSAPPGAPWVLHWDDNPRNNHISNLRWGSPRENTLDSVRNGTHFEYSKTHCAAGHEYSEGNTRVRNRKRACRSCDRIAQQARRDKVKSGKV